MEKLKQQLKYGSVTLAITLAGLGNSAHGACAYDRQAAVTYSNQYATSQNSSYPYYSGNDCANFVSQCLIKGGIDMEKHANPAFLAGPTGYKTIPNVGNLTLFLFHHSASGGQTKELGPGISTSTPTLKIGDVVAFNHNNDFVHSVFVVQTTQGIMEPLYAEDALVNSHSTYGEQNNYKKALIHFWNAWPFAYFFHINKTRDEQDPVCDDGTGGCPTCCGQLQKRWAPTAAN